jgi:rod shape-determining protein MreC
MTELIAARRRMAIFLGLFLCVVALLTSQARSPDRRQIGAIGTAVLTVLLPVQVGMARVADGVERMWTSYTEIGQLRTENARLRKELEGLSRERGELREQATAAQRLERLLELRGQIAYRSLAAQVIGRDPSRWFGTLLLDRGSRDGVRRNAPVVAADGVVGRVIEVTRTASRVLLVSDSRSAIGVVLQRSRDLAVVEGRSDRVLHLKYLSQTAQVLPGDLVVTSGQGGVFPKGLVVGRITRVTREEGELLQEAEVEPVTGLDRLEEVLILLPK